MAEEGRSPGQEPALSLSASAAVRSSALTLNLSLRIGNEQLATRALAGAGVLVFCAVTALWCKEPELVYGAVKSALEILGTRVVNIFRGSILVELQCDTKEGLLSFVEAFEANIVKQRLEEEFRKIGFKEELEVTIINEDEVYQKLNQIRQERETREAGESSDNVEGTSAESDYYSVTGGQKTAAASQSSQETSPGILTSDSHSAHRLTLSLFKSAPVREECCTPGIGKNFFHLPLPAAHFVNRKKDIEAIKNYLSPENDCRCVLVHGAVGMGKTATAIKAVNEIRETDPESVVLYANCRSMASLYDLATTIDKQLHHFPINEPVSEIKRRLIHETEFNTILLLDNFEVLLHPSDGGDAEEQPGRIRESEILTFISEILTNSTQVQVLVTSSEKIVFPETVQKGIRLLPFNKDDSFELLKKVYGDTSIEKETAYKIAEFCGGIPLVLRSLASWQDNPSDLVEMITNARPEKAFEFFARIPTATEDKKIKVSLDACFNRLDAHLQDRLVSLTLFRGLFTMSRAVEVFQSAGLTGIEISELAQRSFLEQNILHLRAPCQYSLLTVIKLYCQDKSTDTRFHGAFSDARKLFIEHYLALLKAIFKDFLSTNVSQAITVFRQEDENILQLIEWLAENGVMDEDQVGKCIDVFNEVGELLAKMMGKMKFDAVFTILKKKCEDMEDQTRLSECLTSLGIKEVFNCCCLPGLCNKAAERAKRYLMEADRIQSSLGINDGNSRAQCLAKLGRCLAKMSNFHEGKEKIQRAISIRKARADEDIVMLGATYNDLGVALSLEGEHRRAIQVREEQTLKIYREKLGNHPFTGTIFNNLANNYFALNELDNAQRNSEAGLKIRRELLKDHRDTAKSLFDLGMVHKQKNEFEMARDYLEQCEAMQKKVLDANTSDLERTRKELNDVRNHLVERNNQQVSSSLGDE